MPLRGHGIIGHRGGSGPRPRIALAIIFGIITALRLLYHVRFICQFSGKKNSYYTQKYMIYCRIENKFNVKFSK
ncbi:hypothetical protein ANACOL_04378 [Anaerotruncus colihominis DSM 17241]|uniref:Uncharacterized protein n=1 Tax=Anaerotruncus colihominis DSM 17241 TaxID=445972 RepID=B0PHT5_9FIRM|nr:hypothetical protein ANACOL_04378 [Anaerotruncus colihominis DSM 17241]